jgi:hypothetical protein
MKEKKYEIARYDTKTFGTKTEDGNSTKKRSTER